jgi:hypothetical protein
MAKLTATRIRAFFAGVFALVLVILLLSVGTAMFGMEIPVLGTIARTIGIDPAAHMSEDVSISQ